MIDKQLLREAVAEMLESEMPYNFKYVDKEILNSREFIQKIYRKSQRLFCWLPLYLDDLDLYKTIIEEQEKIKLGNAFNNFCKNAKLIKPNHKIDLDNMTHKENDIFKEFVIMYNINYNYTAMLKKIADYPSYVLAQESDRNTEIDMLAYIRMKSDGALHDSFVDMARDILKEAGEKF